MVLCLLHEQLKKHQRVYLHGVLRVSAKQDDIFVPGKKNLSPDHLDVLQYYQIPNRSYQDFFHTMSDMKNPTDEDRLHFLWREFFYVFCEAVFASQRNTVRHFRITRYVMVRAW